MTGIPTPGVDYEEMKEKIENGEYDSLKNGHEIYNAPNGMKINIEDQEGADLVTGGNSRDLHQEALDSNKTANQGFTSNTISDGFGNLPEVVNTETPTNTEQLDPESLRRQEDLRRFRDQVNVGMSESIPETSPLRPIVDLHQEVVDRKITEEAVNEAIASGTPMKVKVQRTSGEIEDDWYVLSIFTDDNGVERAKVVKTDPSSGLQLTKNIPVEDLEKLNSTEEEKPIGHFDSMIEPDEAKGYENSFGQLENLKTVQDIRKEIREAIEKASSTNTQKSEGLTTTPQETVQERETTPNVDVKVLEALNQIISFIEETRKRFPNDPEVQKSANNTIISIGSLTVNINSVQSGVAKDETSQSTKTQQSTTSEQKSQEQQAQDTEDQEQQGATQDETKAENENLSPEDLERKKLIFSIEELTKAIVSLREANPNNIAIQNLASNLLISIGNATVNINIYKEGGANGGGKNEGGGEDGGDEGKGKDEKKQDSSATEQNINQESRELSWEEQSGNLARQIAEWDRIAHEERELTDAEKIQYFDLIQKKQYIDNLIISPTEQEGKAKRANKERIIGLVAGAAGFGAALLTAPLSAPALIAVTLGGGVLGKVARWGSEKLRSKSTAMKYESRAGKTPEEIEAFEKKIKRNEWWANRLGEVSAAVIGGATGFGLGKLAQNIFGWGKAAAGSNISEATPTGEASSSIGAEQPAPRPIPQGSIEAPLQGGAEVPGESVLVQNGRVNLPGSAWNGNLAQGPAQDILAGGATNHSNYAGGIYDMAASTLEKDLVSNGITRTKLFEAMDTSEVHQLLNRYVNAISGGNTQPSLQEALSSVNSTASTTLLGN